MKKLEIKQMKQIQGGTASGFIKWTGILSCAAATLWPIGTAIAGPTCAGWLLLLPHPDF